MLVNILFERKSSVLFEAQKGRKTLRLYKIDLKSSLLKERN